MPKPKPRPKLIDDTKLGGELFDNSRSIRVKIKQLIAEGVLKAEEIYTDPSFPRYGVHYRLTRGQSALVTSRLKTEKDRQKGYAFLEKYFGPEQDVTAAPEPPTQAAPPVTSHGASEPDPGTHRGQVPPEGKHDSSESEAPAQELPKVELASADVVMITLDGRSMTGNVLPFFSYAGKIWGALAFSADLMGLDKAYHVEQIQKQKYAQGKIILITAKLPGDTQARTFLAVEEDAFYFWVARLNTNMISEWVRPLVEDFQAASMKAIHAARKAAQGKFDEARDSFNMAGEMFRRFDHMMADQRQFMNALVERQDARIARQDERIDRLTTAIEKLAENGPADISALVRSLRTGSRVRIDTPDQSISVTKHGEKEGLALGEINKRLGLPFGSRFLKTKLQEMGIWDDPNYIVFNNLTNNQTGNHTHDPHRLYRLNRIDEILERCKPFADSYIIDRNSKKIAAAKRKADKAAKAAAKAAEKAAKEAAQQAQQPLDLPNIEGAPSKKDNDPHNVN